MKENSAAKDNFIWSRKMVLKKTDCKVKQMSIFGENLELQSVFDEIRGASHYQITVFLRRKFFFERNFSTSVFGVSLLFLNLPMTSRLYSRAVSTWTI